MTSLQLAQRALSFTKLPTDPASIPAGVAATVAGAINAGLARYYISAPVGRRTTPVSFFLEAPQTISINLVLGSFSTSGLTLTGDRTGDTIEVLGKRLRLAIGANLRDPWTAATGTYEGTLYDDAIALYAPIRRIEGHIIYDEARRLPFLADTPLTQDEAILPGATSQPAFYSIENLGDAVGSSAKAIVRLYPPPIQAASIRFAASIEAQALTIQQLSEPIHIYATDMDIEAFIVPLISSELALTQFWQDGASREMAIAKGRETENFLRTYHEPTGPSMSRVITPVGF